jgi:hypothetical protein
MLSYFRMIVNLQSDGDIEDVIVLQFNAQLKDGTVIHNTFFNGVWGWDFRNDTVPLQRGAEFSIDFHSDKRHIKVKYSKLGSLYGRWHVKKIPINITMKASSFLSHTDWIEVYRGYCDI